jgi:hypothetical protein
MSAFSTWSRKNLEDFADGCYDELLATRADLRTAIDAYRTLLKATHDTPHLQQLPTEQVQPDWNQHSNGQWNQIPLDLPHL